MSKLIDAPAEFVPIQSIAYAEGDGTATNVGLARPLPVAATLVASNAAPLFGAISASAVLGPFAPQLGRPLWATLSGSWSGSVQLLRSTDGGATKLPLTYGDGTVKAVWAGNANAAVTEETVATATYWLAATIATGTLNYRLEQ
ncbi:MAG TPA: hypothetical protein VF503_26490 [Sphingobium sp.]|uniref:hypothetical protein n=1 Tax=Sphingobium sp. TaxID=1912891 RepID=UPI002ED1EAC4